MRIELEPLPRGAYRVWFEGEVLVERTHDPEFAACRALRAKGRTGFVMTYRRGENVPRLIVDVERGAELYTTDRNNGRPTFETWHPHPGRVAFADNKTRQSAVHGETPSPHPQTHPTPKSPRTAPRGRGNVI